MPSQLEVPQGFARQVLGAVLVAKLLAFAVGMFVANSESISALGVLCLALSAVATGACLWSNRALDYVVKHPVLVLIDLLLVVGLIAGVGIDNPLVLAAYPTAFLIGLLTRLRVVIPLAVILITGYVSALGNTDLSRFSPATVVSIPMLFVFLIGLGSVVRVFQLRYMRSNFALVKAREEAVAASERARLAREMHDSLAKTLYGVVMAAKSLGPTLEQDEQRARRTADLVADGAERAADESRQILDRLRADIPEGALSEAITRVCERWQETNAIPIRVDLHDLSEGFPLDHRYEVLAIIGEALENISRHSNAEQAGLRVTNSDTHTTIEVFDDGDGFNPEEISTARYGLVGMRERAQLIGADLSISSVLNEGTTIAMTLTRDGAKNVSS